MAAGTIAGSHLDAASKECFHLIITFYLMFGKRYDDKTREWVPDSTILRVDVVDDALDLDSAVNFAQREKMAEIRDIADQFQEDWLRVIMDVINLVREAADDEFSVDEDRGHLLISSEVRHFVPDGPTWSWGWRHGIVTDFNAEDGQYTITWADGRIKDSTAMYTWFDLKYMLLDPPELRASGTTILG